MKVKSVTACLLAAVMLTSCSLLEDLSKPRSPEAVKVPELAELHARDGVMMYVSSSNVYMANYYDDELSGIGYSIDWDGTVTRTVYYSISDPMTSTAVLGNADFEKFYRFGEYCRYNDPYKGYSEKVYDGTTYSFHYYYDANEQPFEIYRGYCYQVDELQDIEKTLYYLFPQPDSYGPNRQTG